MDLRRAIVTGVVRRESAVDFQTAQAARLEGLHDSEVLRLAAGERRVLVSHDFSTMPRHFLQFTASHYSPGVLLVPQYLRIAEAIDCLLLVWEASGMDEWENRICLVPSLNTYLMAGQA
ncbi:MAG: DUF5615 family PIN-like protein [Acidobacteria bacterium]|nr:DUF5615 family PIN-like protein [Acidobacteriota bacterium]